MIVVDIGCHPQGPEESIYRLGARFHPDLLFGFDPFPDLEEGIEHAAFDGHACVIIRRRAAAWLHAGGIPFQTSGITSGLMQPVGPSISADLARLAAFRVPSFDLAAFILTLPHDRLILKLDCEGSEYPLVEHLTLTGADKRIELALIEWHPPETAHGMYQETPAVLRCPVEEW